MKRTKPQSPERQSGAAPDKSKREGLSRKNAFVFEGHDAAEWLQEVLPVLGGAAPPNAWKRDWLLWRAKRVAKRAKAAHLHGRELRAVAWFAFLPGAGDNKSEETRFNLVAALLSPHNEFARVFANVWLREPDTVVCLLAKLREKMGDGETEQAEHDFLEADSAGKMPPKGVNRKMDAARERVKAARRMLRPKSEVTAALKSLQRKPSGS